MRYVLQTCHFEINLECIILRKSGPRHETDAYNTSTIRYRRKTLRFSWQEMIENRKQILIMGLDFGL